MPAVFGRRGETRTAYVSVVLSNAVKTKNGASSSTSGSLKTGRGIALPVCLAGPGTTRRPNVRPRNRRGLLETREHHMFSLRKRRPFDDACGRLGTPATQPWVAAPLPALAAVAVCYTGPLGMAIRPDAGAVAGGASVSTAVQRSTIFARAEAPPGESPGTSGLSSPFLDAISLSNAGIALQAVALPFAFWFKPICLLLATIWLFYRASQVLQKPLEDLAGLLGFDIPSTPKIDLASIKADGAIIHWALPEKQKHKSTLKFEIHVNGVVVDTLSVQESAATVTGLQPDRFYIVRVSLVNNIEFASKSEPIRFRTKSATSGDFFVAPQDAHAMDRDSTHEAIPRVRPYRGLKDISTALPDAMPLSRESSSTAGHRRSFGSARRLSPAGPGVERRESTQDDLEAPEGAETIQQLTEKLDTIRRENEVVERLAKEEEEEEFQQRDEFVRERDELRAEVAEREKANRALQKEVRTLEHQNQTAQTERAKQERMLFAKKQERQRFKDEGVRWERETSEMNENVERIRESKAEHLRKAGEEKQSLEQRIAEEVAHIKNLEDEAKEKNAQIKRVEQTIRNLVPDGSDPQQNLVHMFQKQAEEERMRDIQLQKLHQQYTNAVQLLEQNRISHAEHLSVLETIRANRRRQDEVAQYASPPSTQERLPRRGDSQRSRRAQSGQSASESPRLGNFPMSSNAFAPGMTSTTNMFPLAVLPSISIPPGENSLSDEDRNRLTGGALMSPGAGALLPADLFKDPDIVEPLPGLGSLPGFPGRPGPANSPAAQDQSGPGPASPISASSQSPSLFTSPQASQQNLQLGSPENMIDADRRSIRSTRSNRAASNSGGGYGSRFSTMFGKQRAKTNPLSEGPALGTAQSQSLPRQDQGFAGIDSKSRKRNSSISGSVYGAQDSGNTEETAPTSRRKTFNLFSKDKADGWPSSFTGFGRRPTSPRPGSTHSNELPVPRASSDFLSRWGSEAWSPGESGAVRGSPLAFNTNWNVPGQQSRLFGSRLPSRRPSVQYGGSAPPDDIIEDEDSEFISGRNESYLAPIGTRRLAQPDAPDDVQAGGVPKLNPNAKDFRSLFKLRDKAKDSGTPGPSSSITRGLDSLDNEESPPASGRSRDTRSMTTTESSIAESGRNSADLARTVSYTNSEAAPSPLIGSGSAGKESFMSKLTRKSSSGGKMSLPTFKRDKSRLDPGSATSTTSTHAEDDEESLSASLSSLKEREPRESKERVRGSGRGWSNFLKTGKKKGNDTPSLSGEGEDAEEDMNY